MTLLKITPLDAWFFRDSRPFYRGETHRDVESLFPPSAFTLVGAIRAHLARRMGWKEGAWPPEIVRVLGDGEDLGALRFRGPFLGKGEGNAISAIYPAPAHLLGTWQKDGWSEFLILEPGEERSSDLGKVRYPAAAGSRGKKALTDWYLTPEDISKVLQRRTEGLTLVPPGVLRETEHSIGIELERGTRTAKDRHLYSIQKIRLPKNVCLLAEVEGAIKEFDDRFAFLLGGESRMAIAEVCNETDLRMRVPSVHIPSEDGCIRFTLIHLTPAHFRDLPGPGGRIPGVPGRVVSACMNRPIRVGRWDSVRGCPVETKPFVRPGTTWFLEAEENDRAAVERMHHGKIGEYTAFGFGEVVIGGWSS
ncbi:MAG: type III-B CRISPR module-associated protein Cmr3 [Methanomicrobiales archaeon]|nr:type III-B CRISPR module-associated protein Cmr3 [Methanomicrobiales archaeon]MDI6876071.1 type III-B CRISPR module-associated protein Cmr3 [Methanomicrobiales archaeon]